MILRTIDGRELFAADRIPAPRRCDHVGFVSPVGGDEFDRLRCENCGQHVDRDDVAPTGE